MKKIWILFLLLLTTCTTDEFEPTPAPVLTTFEIKENTLSDQDPITFNLKEEGIYNLVLLDGTQVVSREKFKGKIGKNNMKLYTRTLKIKYLYLVLQDVNGNQIGKTTLILK